jgi:hypothetical protein
MLMSGGNRDISHWQEITIRDEPAFGSWDKMDLSVNPFLPHRRIPHPVTDGQAMELLGNQEETDCEETKPTHPYPTTAIMPCSGNSEAAADLKLEQRCFEM